MRYALATQGNPNSAYYYVVGVDRELSVNLIVGNIVYCHLSFKIGVEYNSCKMKASMKIVFL